MSKSRFAWNQFGILESYEDLIEYMQREFEHGGYVHYSKLESINSIMLSKEFRLSSVNSLNDRKELDSFDEKDWNHVFSLCFSTGIHENLPLWYMYSGIDGKGGRIRLTNTRVKELYKKGEYFLRLKDGDEGIPLDESNMEKMFQDVIYYAPKKDTDYVDLKYNTMTNHDRITKDEFDKYKATYPGFYKNLIWYYEKETRLLVKLKNDAAKKVDEQKDKEQTKVVVSFQKLKSFINSINIELAPEIDSIDDILRKHEAIKEQFELTSKVKKSEYYGQIKMDLAGRLCRECHISDENVAIQSNS